MTNSELKEYLNKFPDDAPVSIVCANPKKRKVYEPKTVIIMTDEEFTYPAFVIEIKNERNMADEERAMCEECERLFPSEQHKVVCNQHLHAECGGSATISLEVTAEIYLI